jgi:fatty acid desaturase
VGIALGVYGGLVAGIGAHRWLGLWLVVPMLGLVSGWHSSLQHECIHGHPTRVRWVNTAIAALPVGLLFPYGRYRDTHRQHHTTELITDPQLDPESFYVTPEQWASASRLTRLVLRATRTLAGRLVVGPFYFAWRYWRAELRARRVASTLRHLVGVAIVLALVRRTGLPLWAYVLGAGYGGYAVTLFRSFAEHRYVAGETRSAVVDAALAWRVLFLNNTYHHTHHEHADVAWFELPALHRAGPFAAEASKGAGHYAGYTMIARAYLFRPLDHPVRTEPVSEKAAA